MSSELEELVEFLHHGNTQVRQVATQHLVPYSSSEQHQTTLFKRNQNEPLKDLKLLTKDYTQIANDALHIIINLTGCGDREILEYFSRDDVYIEVLLKKTIDDLTDTNADLVCGLLANLVKDDTLAKRFITLERSVPPKTKVKVRLRRTDKGEIEATKSDEHVAVQVSTSKRVLDQFMDVFVKGSNRSLNPNADYDYLSYVFADLSKFEEGRKYLLGKQEYDGVVPITKLVVFTEHGSLTRRKGIASTIKNCAFETRKHGYLLRSESDNGVGLLPYLLLPLAGNEEFDTEDSEGMLDELQLLPPDKEREVDDDIISTHLETLMLLTAERENRDLLRAVKVYPLIRELHLKREAEGIQEGCVRLVNVLMRDEEGEPSKMQALEDNDDHKIEEIF